MGWNHESASSSFNFAKDFLRARASYQDKFEGLENLLRR